MDMDWDPKMQSLPGDYSGLNDTHRVVGIPMRLDTLLPSDPETGTVTAMALRVYLYATMDLMSRHAQPLSIIHLGVDESGSSRCFGSEGARLIGRAVARCVFQETRTHDVVGRAEDTDAKRIPTFLLVCPLMNEEGATNLAERLCSVMTAHAVDSDLPWLTVSAGVAGLSLDVLEPEDMIARATEALRCAQKSGGGRVWRHSESVRRIVDNNWPEPSTD